MAQDKRWHWEKGIHEQAQHRIKAIDPFNVPAGIGKIRVIGLVCESEEFGGGCIVFLDEFLNQANSLIEADVLQDVTADAERRYHEVCRAAFNPSRWKD